MDIKQTGGNQGQAFIELIAGLVVIMVLLSGFVLAAQLFNAHHETLISAQWGAAEAAMTDSPIFGGTYLSGWGVGPDGRRYTRDDVQLWLSNPGEYVDRIAGRVDHTAAAELFPGNPVSTIAAGNDMVAEFGLVSASSMRTVPTLPVVRALFYDRQNISVRSQIYMTWVKGVY